MNKVAIFGKKGSIAKYDLTENKPLWVGNIASGYKPNIIGQYEIEDGKPPVFFPNEITFFKKILSE